MKILYFDPNKLVENLNEGLSRRDLFIQDFKRIQSGSKNPFERWMDRQKEGIWVSEIRQNITYPVFDDMDGKVGYIYIAKYLEGLSDHEPSIIETIKLTINKPLLSSRGDVIFPRSTTKMKASGNWSVSFYDLVYHRRLICNLGARRADLSDLIIPEWFIKDKFVDDYHKGLESRQTIETTYT